jgi:hypothetical protein
MIKWTDFKEGLILIFKLDKDVVFEVIDTCFDMWIIKNISKRLLLALTYDLSTDIMEMSLEEINEKFDVYIENPIDKLSWSLRHEI